MEAFYEKAIFIWNDYVIGDAACITEKLLAAGFEAVYLHSTNLDNWRKTSRVVLLATLKAARLQVYASAAVYGYTPATDGHKAAAIVNEYGLAGFVFDIEKELIETAADAPTRAKEMFVAYKQMTDRPAACCWWAFYRNWNAPYGGYHPKAVLIEAMRHCAVGIPMAYWSWGDDPDDAERYLAESKKQWDELVPGIPWVPAGRAYVGDGGTAKPGAVLAFEQKARSLGAAGVSWWVMENAIEEDVIPGVWDALAQTKGFHDTGGVIVTTDWTTYPIGAVVKTAASMTNPAFKFFVCWAGQDDSDPNPELKPMETKAASMGAAFAALYDFSATWYSDVKQCGSEVEQWPPLDQDIPYQRITGALTSRSPLVVFVRILDEKSRITGQVENGLYLSRAASYFCGRLQDWLNRNKNGVPLVLLTSNDFITQHAPTMNNWVTPYHSCIDQPAVKPLANGAWPNGEEKVNAYLSNHPDWDGWEYWWQTNSKLLIINKASPIYGKLFAATPPVADTTPPSTPAGLAAQVDGSMVTLSWQPSTDAVGVMGYGVWRDGVWLNSYANPGIIDAGVIPGAHTYQVDAYDAAGNHSAKASVTANVGVPPSDLAELIERVTALETEVAEIRRQAVTNIDVHRALAG